MENKKKPQTISRRKALKKGGYFTLMAFVSTATLLVRPDRAHAMSKRAARYKNSPNGNQNCANCRYFYPRSRKCSVVSGKVSPNGWCKLWR